MKDKDKKDNILRCTCSSSYHVYKCTIEINNQIFKNTLGVLAFLPGEGDLVLANCLINDWHPRKFFTGSQESSTGPKPFQCTRYSTLPFLVLLPRIRSTYEINMWIQLLQTYSVNLLITCILCYMPGPVVWLSVASCATSDHRCQLSLSYFARDTCSCSFPHGKLWVCLREVLCFLHQFQFPLTPYLGLYLQLTCFGTSNIDVHLHVSWLFRL